MADRIQIAIDGPASSGKGTVARRLASRLGYAYIDTGSMFRAVALAAEQAGVDWGDEAAVSALIGRLEFEFHGAQNGLEMAVDGRVVSDEIRGERIGGGASMVARYPTVRTALLDLQRRLAAQGGVVMDGRDIGSVVLPKAQLKIYLDASVDTRAHRRFEEMRDRDPNSTYESVREEILRRDRQDQTRSTAPLVRVSDAVYVDTSDLTVEQAVEQIISIAAERI